MSLTGDIGLESLVCEANRTKIYQVSINSLGYRT